MKQGNRNSQGSGGFTLMELLVVIGILAFLLTMLIPVVNRVRQAGYKANTAAQINALRGGCEAYYQTFQAYPGPLSDATIVNAPGAAAAPGNVGGSGRPTMAENLVLGLLGGLNGANGTFNVTLVGQGPASFGTGGKTYKMFYEGNTQLSGDLGRMTADATLGRFKDERGTLAQDTNIPEFVDRFPEPLPILYLRARRGAGGIVTSGSDTPPVQYDVRHVTPYTGVNLSGKTHGLQGISTGNGMVLEPKGNGLPAQGGPPFLADVYLQNPAEYGNTSKNRLTSSPRSKDTYILIGAGLDRTYGTQDDITSFGSILP